jgi:Site-specific recombinase XerD
MASKRFDRYFGGVRITRPSGVDLEAFRTTKAGRREFDYRDGLLTRLWDRGQKDTILAFARQDIDIEDIVTADRLNRLNGLASDIATLKPLWKTWEDIIPRLRTDRGKPISEASRANYTYSMKRLRNLGVLPENALIADLEKVDWTKPYQAWETSPASWNHLGRALSRFLTVVLGDKFHPLRRKIAREFPKMDEHPRMPSLNVAQFMRIIDMLPPQYQAPFIVLAVTGMRLGEMMALSAKELDQAPMVVKLNGQEVKVFGINIRDAKTPAGVRKIYVAEEFWPYVQAAVPARASHWYLRDVWNAAVDRAFPKGDVDLRIHDLRHFAGQSLSSLGISDREIATQLGHADVKTTGIYTRQQARAEIAAKMATVFAPMKATTGGR